MHVVKHCLLAVVLVALVGCSTESPRPLVKPADNGQSTASAAAYELRGPQVFDGKTLTGWKATDFAGRGDVKVENGQIQLGMGYMTGITWTGGVPRMNYEISLDAMRVDGSDFFCGLTFPVGTNYCSFIVGGWGGGVVGLSSVDGQDASENETTKYLNFETGRWYHIRLRVVPGNIKAWIDNDEMVNLDTEEKRFSIRLEVEPSVPLGISTWNTAAALKNIQLKSL